jgi:hypothetical protein
VIKTIPVSSSANEYRGKIIKHAEIEITMCLNDFILLGLAKRYLVYNPSFLFFP